MFNSINIPTSGDVPELLVYVGPVPVQRLKIDRRVMQKMSLCSRKAEHDWAFLYFLEGKWG